MRGGEPILLSGGLAERWFDEQQPAPRVAETMKVAQALLQDERKFLLRVSRKGYRGSLSSM